MSLLAPIVPAAELEPLQSEAISFLLSGASPGPGEALALSIEPEVVLGPQERAAVLVSLRDSRASAARSRRRSRFMRIVFGQRRRISLADDRLEALRRYAILYRLEGAALSREEEERLLGAGLSDRHATAARALVDAHYMPVRDRPRVPWTLAAMVGLAGLGATFLYRWLAAQFADSAGALIVTIMLAAWVVSFAAITGHPQGRRA
jgi:hypothetical protein